MIFLQPWISKCRTYLQPLHPENIPDFSPNLLKSPIFIFAGVYHNMTPTQRMHYYYWEIPQNDQQHFSIMFWFFPKTWVPSDLSPLFCGPVLVFTVWQRIVIIGHVHLVSTRWSLKIADRVAVWRQNTPAMTKKKVSNQLYDINISVGNSNLKVK